MSGKDGSSPAHELVQSAVFAALEEGVVVLDAERRLVDANPAAATILGIDLETARGRRHWWRACLPPGTGVDATDDVGARVLRTNEGLRDVPVEIVRDGARVMMSANYVPLRDPAGAVCGLVVSFRDITEREREHRALRTLSERLREAHEVARLSSWEWQAATGDVLVFTALAEEQDLVGTRTSLEELLGGMPVEARLQAREDLHAIVRGDRDEQTRRHRYELESGPLWLETRSRAVRDDGGALICVRGTSQDVTEQTAAELALLEARNYLTAVTDSMGEGLFALDTDGRVTYMNAAAERLLGWSLSEVRGEIMHDLAHTCRLDGSPLALVDCPMRRARRDGETIRVDDDVFIRRGGGRFPVAYTAAPFVRTDGIQGCVVVFEDISERKAREDALQREADRLAWIDRIQDALAEDRFVLYAQPIVDLRTGQTVQRELLLRLIDRDGSVVAPGSYLPIAEQYGLIGDIDRWVIQRGIQIAEGGLPVEINVSARSIGDPTILDHFERCLRRSRTDPNLLVVEITETALAEDEAAARAFVERLHGLGCKIALDDFGTGYGTLTYLKRLPVDYLKIDIEFVRDLASNPASHHVVEAVVAIAHAFDLRTVGEGVEDAETLELLRQLGVDCAQGYHLARPAPLNEGLARAA